MPSTSAEIPEAYEERPAIVEKPASSEQVAAKVVRLRLQITGILKQSGEDGQEYEPNYEKRGEQIIAVVYLAGTKEVCSEGPAASDVVTAYENLLDKIKTEKSSKQ